MRTFIAIAVLLLFSCTVRAQDSSKIPVQEVMDHDQYAKYWINDNLCDTLFLEDGTPAFFLRTPIRYIQGNTTLFKTDGSLYDAEVLVNPSFRHKGYLINWTIKNNKLYVSRIVWKRIEMYGPDRNGVVCSWKGKEVLPDVVKERFEKLTGRKFGEDGLMLADWVTDAVRVTKYHPYRPAIHPERPIRPQETLELEFMKGELKGVNAITRIGKDVSFK